MCDCGAGDCDSWTSQAVKPSEGLLAEEVSGPFLLGEGIFRVVFWIE